MGVAETKDAKETALEEFGKWSNYLLVTTVAATGWIASKNVSFTSGNMRSAAIACLGVSIVSGIFALALVPLVAQTMKIESSIYRVKVEYWIFGHRYHAFLTQACRPQHVFFIAGITLYCVGTVEQQWIVPAVAALAAIYGVFSKRQQDQTIQTEGQPNT